MINWLLALLTIVVWVTAYAWYAADDIKAWWKRRRERGAR
jgi:hypothetical protein